MPDHQGRHPVRIHFQKHIVDHGKIQIFFIRRLFKQFPVRLPVHQTIDNLPSDLLKIPEESSLKTMLETHLPVQPQNVPRNCFQRTAVFKLLIVFLQIDCGKDINSLLCKRQPVPPRPVILHSRMYVHRYIALGFLPDFNLYFVYKLKICHPSPFLTP